MFTKKTSKRESCKKGLVTWYRSSRFPHEYWNSTIRVLSIDPGIVNFCVRVEDRDRTGCVRTVWTDKKTFDQCEEFMDVYGKMSDYMDSIYCYFSGCHYCIIERQMVENYQSTRVAQHIITYLMLRLANSPVDPVIAEIDSKAKYSELDAPSHLNKIALKKWGQEEAKRILGLRGEHDLIAYINGSKGVRGQKKQDDLCDVIIQAEAFFRLYPISNMVHYCNN